MKNIITPTREVIRLNIIMKRKEAGWTQAELAERVGFKKNTVASWEQGLSTPNVETIIKLLDLFNMNFYEFTGTKCVKNETRGKQ